MLFRSVDVQSPQFPALKAEKEGTIATFKIPDLFTGPAAPPFKSPAKLTEWQWIHLARTNNLTTALSLKKLLNPNYDDVHADKPAFLWEKQSGAVIDTTEGEAASRVSTSIEEGQAYHHFLVDAAIAGKYGFCEASVKASYKMDTEEKSYAKVIHVRARWKQDRCKLVMAN